MQKSHFFVLLKSFSAGQPIFLCLQYLQANDPLTTTFPPNPRMTKIANNTTINQEKSESRSIIPPIRGRMNVRKSGIMSFIVISVLINFSGLPFLKNNAQHFPLPKAQNFP